MSCKESCSLRVYRLSASTISSSSRSRTTASALIWFLSDASSSCTNFWSCSSAFALTRTFSSNAARRMVMASSRVLRSCSKSAATSTSWADSRCRISPSRTRRSLRSASNSTVSSSKRPCSTATRSSVSCTSRADSCAKRTSTSSMRCASASTRWCTTTSFSWTSVSSLSTAVVTCDSAHACTLRFISRRRRISELSFFSSCAMMARSSAMRCAAFSCRCRVPTRISVSKASKPSMMDASRSFVFVAPAPCSSRSSLLMVG
mmetsp:Transcript_41418/g.129715  ORF Transcript_41418/g.129715 Transcript_41418/m.129715 type:complete len:261 (+) Transcript_41418:2548-3330(+)